VSRRFWLWTTTGVASALLVTLAVVFASRFGTDPSLAPSPLVGRPAPSAPLDAIEGGGTIDPANLSGSIVVVNFWAPWCVPCREEHGVLVAAAEAYGPSGVTVIGIAYDSELEDVVAFLDALGRGYPVAMDTRSRATIAYGVRGVPETFFIDRTGEVAAKVNGAVDADLMRSTLDTMLLGGDLDLGQP
jgi:cytochrome c biogenesis protein CcmG/thiol:disulfide interchange protein DsbE